MKIQESNPAYSPMLNGLSECIKNYVKLSGLYGRLYSASSISYTLVGHREWLLAPPNNTDSVWQLLQNNLDYIQSEVLEIVPQEDIDLLWSQNSIMLYTYLEEAVRQLIKNYCKHNDINKIKEIGNLKIPFSAYNSLNNEEVFEYMMGEYEYKFAQGSLYGIDRFEKLLKPLNFSVAVEKIDKKLVETIFELAQKRNIFLHKNGFADPTFVERCPWLNYKINDRVTTSGDEYKKYYSACFAYIRTLLLRIFEMDNKKKKDVEISITQALNALK